MSDLVTDARAFLAELAINNRRDWWEANKPRYEAGLKAPALAQLDRLAGPVAALTGHPVTGKLFRPHRDVRFSRDKTPYTTHLHLAWMLDMGGRQQPGLIFGIAPDYVKAGVCVFGFAPPVLTDWRRLLDLDQSRMGGLLAQAEAGGLVFDPPDLARVPAPHAADHPLERFLRMKSLFAVRELPVAPVTDGDLLAVFRTCLPVLAALGPVL